MSKVRVSEQIQRALAGAIEASWAGLLVIDEAQRIVYGNRGAARMFGYRVASLLGKPLDVLLPRDRTHEHERLVYRFGSGRARSRPMAGPRDVTCRRKDGTEFKSHITIGKIRDGGCLFFVAQFHDVSERDAAREARERTEHRFETLVRHLPDVVMTLDADSTIRYINWTLPQYTVGDVLGTRAVAYLERESGERYLAALAHVLASGEPETIDITTPEPHVTHWNVRLVPIAPSGTPGCVLVIASDVTRYREAGEAAVRSGERFRQLVESIAEVYWLWEPVSGQDLYISPSFESVWGRTPAEVYSQPDLWLESVHPDDREAMRASLANAPQRLPYEEEYRLLRPDGSVRWVRDRAFEVPGRAGDPSLVASVIEDVTERKQAREELEASRARLRELSRYLIGARERERARVARELHDELGQTLTVLKLDVAALAASIAPDDTAARERAATMNDRLDELARFSRDFAARLRSPVLDELGLEAAVRHELDALRERTGIQVDLDCAVEEVTIDGPLATTVFRILQEALTNVVRHARASRVYVRCEPVHRELVVMVQDDGVGIQPASLASPRSIGLTGMRERAGIVGGDLTIDSSPGAGTTVTIRLPLRGLEAAPGDQAKPLT